jgi:hypothetical protein
VPIHSAIPEEKKRTLDPEGGYDDPDEGMNAELNALAGQNEISMNALPNKDYLEKTIMPTVLKALTMVAESRPANPIEFVAYYLLKHNPDFK